MVVWWGGQLKKIKPVMFAASRGHNHHVSWQVVCVQDSMAHAHAHTGSQLGFLPCCAALACGYAADAADHSPRWVLGARRGRPALWTRLTRKRDAGVTQDPSQSLLTRPPHNARLRTHPIQLFIRYS